MRILTISTGKVAKILVNEGGPARTVHSAINKAPVSTLNNPQGVFAGHLGLEQDEQADHNVHGGPGMAVYAYPVEHYPFWQNLLETQRSDLRILPHGFFGENLTVEGFVEKDVFEGDVWTVGEVEFMVEKLREPCFKFDAKIGFSAGPSMILTARSGWYLRVLTPGIIHAGDVIEVSAGERLVSIADQNAMTAQKRRLSAN